MIMDWLNLVIVEPMYQQNLGYIARVSKNFAIKRLNLVRPRCNYRGKEAIKYSKHARELLENAKISDSVKEATKGTFVVGTTALWRKTGKAFYNVYTPEKLLDSIKRRKIRRVSLLIGRDDTGLTKDELASCDASVFIPAASEYPALNISHALAILLYAFSEAKGTEIDGLGAKSSEIGRLSRLFKMMVSERKDIRDRHAVSMAFDHIIKRSAPTKKELGALSVALSPRHQMGKDTKLLKALKL